MIIKIKIKPGGNLIDEIFYQQKFSIDGTFWLAELGVQMSRTCHGFHAVWNTLVDYIRHWYKGTSIWDSQTHHTCTCTSPSGNWTSWLG